MPNTKFGKRHLGFSKLCKFYWQNIKSFVKLLLHSVSILENILLVVFTNINYSNNTMNFDDKEIARVGDKISDNIIGKKVKNLLIAKNIKKLTRSKKSNFAKAKANKGFKTSFFIIQVKLACSYLRQIFSRHQFFSILIKNIILKF